MFLFVIFKMSFKFCEWELFTELKGANASVFLVLINLCYSLYNYLFLYYYKYKIKLNIQTQRVKKTTRMQSTEKGRKRW